MDHFIGLGFLHGAQRKLEVAQIGVNGLVLWAELVEGRRERGSTLAFEEEEGNGRVLSLQQLRDEKTADKPGRAGN